MTVLLMRNFEDSAFFAKKIKLYGIDTFIEPMFKVQYLLEPDLYSYDLALSQAIIFTSKNALNAIKTLSNKLTHLKCFVVGDATAKLAKEYNFQEVYIANNNAESLLELIVNECNKKQGILYFCGEKVAFDLQR